MRYHRKLAHAQLTRRFISPCHVSRCKEWMSREQTRLSRRWYLWQKRVIPERREGGHDSPPTENWSAQGNGVRKSARGQRVTHQKHATFPTQFLVGSGDTRQRRCSKRTPLKQRNIYVYNMRRKRKRKETKEITSAYCNGWQQSHGLRVCPPKAAAALAVLADASASSAGFPVCGTLKCTDRSTLPLVCVFGEWLPCFDWRRCVWPNTVWLREPGTYGAFGEFT